MPSTSANPYTPICLEGSHSATVSCVDFLDEDRHIITCSEDGSIQVREVATGHVVGKPLTDPGSGAIHAMALSRNRTIVTGSQDGRIRLCMWTEATMKMTGKWKKVHTRAILSVCWSPNEVYIASGSEDGTAIIWDAKTGKIVGDPIITDHRHVYAVRYSSDGAKLVTSGYDNNITFWDVRTREALRVVEACHASQQVHCVTLTSDGRLFLGCSNGMVQTSTDTQEKVCLGERTDRIRAIVLSQDESLLATARNNTISLWDPKTNQSVGRPLEHAGQLRCAAVARNGRLLASSGVDRNVYIWDLQALLDRNVNVTGNESGSTLDTSTAGQFFLDVDAMTRRASNHTRQGSRHDANMLDGAYRLSRGCFDAPDNYSASPPSPRPRDERGTTQLATSPRRSVLQVTAARAWQVCHTLHLLLYVSCDSACP
ncbi:WD40-repeat-containing domain protein [Suillus ampliporus]|nr:WD40-repeat-containing domain protein [Suillus ampliporus]